ncbi:hypothetical protein [Thalassovita sp.]|jgi:hypothetical protein|uniref:hypothetical protein n=1 Tax=Thalassovita sp. TaxID=1979401 RepID=UPI003B5B4E5E
MRNAQIFVAGHPPRSSGLANEKSIRRLMTEAGMSAGICLEWLLDRFEHSEAGR